MFFQFCLVFFYGFNLFSLLSIFAPNLFCSTEVLWLLLVCFHSFFCIAISFWRFFSFVFICSDSILVCSSNSTRYLNDNERYKTNTNLLINIDKLQHPLYQQNYTKRNPWVVLYVSSEAQCFCLIRKLCSILEVVKFLYS